MSSRSSRLVRRAPLWQKMQTMLNPMDLYLRVSEEIQTFDWDSKNFGTRFGLAANFLFLLVRANTARNELVDDVFSDAPRGGWLHFLIGFLSLGLTGISLFNAFYAMQRSRQYRLFEADVEQTGPSTPNAQRVRVDSSPASSSPMRYLQDILSSESASTRAHPDSTRDVWEISVWDPFPATLRILCLFSPGHVLVYMLFLPLTDEDPRPKMTVLKCLVLQVLMSTQLLLLQARYSQQAKDTAIIQREVMHEYDTKYVHPQLHPVYREATTQITMGQDGIDYESVDVGTPTTMIRRGFKTNPNPNYAKHYDPDSTGPVRQRNVMSPTMFTPLGKSISRPGGVARQSLPSPSPSLHHGAGAKSTMTSTGVGYGGAGTGFGGSLGVFTHANSPLKKATSMDDVKNPGMFSSPRNSREMAALEQRDTADRMVRQSSPYKDNRRTTTQSAQPPNPFAFARHRFTQERFPSLR